MKVTITIVFILWPIAVLFAALGTAHRPTPLNIVVLASLTLGFILIILVSLFFKKEKRQTSERIKQDRIRQEHLLEEVEKIAGKEIADQFRC